MIGNRKHMIVTIQIFQKSYNKISGINTILGLLYQFFFIFSPLEAQYTLETFHACINFLLIIISEFILKIIASYDYEITLVRLSVRPSVRSSARLYATKFSQGQIISFFMRFYMMIADHEIQKLMKQIFGKNVITRTWDQWT